VAKGRQIMEGISRAVLTELPDDPIARDLWKKAARIPKKIGRPKRNPRGKILPLLPGE
jgi:hypothetical protein